MSAHCWPTSKNNPRKYRQVVKLKCLYLSVNLNHNYNIEATFLCLITNSVENNKSIIILKWMSLNYDAEIELSLHHGLVRQNCVLGEHLVWESISNCAVPD